MNLLRSANPQDIRQCLHGSVPCLAGVQPSSLRAEFTRIYLFNGHEHNSNPCSPSEALVHAVQSFLYSSQRHLARTCVQPARITPSDCALIGPLNLREGFAIESGLLVLCWAVLAEKFGNEGPDRDHEEAQSNVHLQWGTNCAALLGMPCCNVMIGKRWVVWSCSSRDYIVLYWVRHQWLEGFDRVSKAQGSRP